VNIIGIPEIYPHIYSQLTLMKVTKNSGERKASSIMLERLNEELN
jgi:hypothetical protein